MCALVSNAWVRVGVHSCLHAFAFAFHLQHCACMRAQLRACAHDCAQPQSVPQTTPPRGGDRGRPRMAARPFVTMTFVGRTRKKVARSAAAHCQCACSAPVTPGCRPAGMVRCVSGAATRARTRTVRRCLCAAQAGACSRRPALAACAVRFLPCVCCVMAGAHARVCRLFGRLEDRSAAAVTCEC